MREEERVGGSQRGVVADRSERGDEMAETECHQRPACVERLLLGGNNEGCWCKEEREVLNAT